MTVPQPHRRRASRSRAPASTGSLSRAAWREFALLAVVYELYTATRRISTGGADGAIANARHVLRMVRLAGLTPERWQPRRTSRDPSWKTPGPFAHLNPVTENVPLL
jgi:hypothetical protein